MQIIAIVVYVYTEVRISMHNVHTIATVYNVYNDNLFS